MASCARVEGLIQAFIDGEAAPSERMIVEQHIAECNSCAELVRAQKRCTALMFEAFSEDRLHTDLSGPVLSNLPEMEGEPFDVYNANWRIKHPHKVADWLHKLAPAAAAAVIAVLATLLTLYWPETLPNPAAIGVVAHSMGDAQRIGAGEAAHGAVRVTEFVQPEERYVTGDGSTLMLSLAGRTAVKLNQNSRVRIFNEHRIGLEKGRIWVDVGQDARLFRVQTPTGDVTVFGTVFDVEVYNDATVVTVARGQVQVENDRTFTLVAPNEQVTVAVGVQHLERRTANAERELAWSRAIQPDDEAGRVFERLLERRGEPLHVSAEKVFAVPAWQGRRRLALESLRLEWETPSYVFSGFCSYDIYVTDQKLRPVFRARIDGGVLADSDQQWYDLDLNGQDLRDVDVLHVKLVPDYTNGREEADFVKVYGIGR